MKRMNTKIAVAILILGAICGFVLLHGDTFQKFKDTNIKYVTINKAKVKVELATTKDEQTLGLSGRDGLDAGTGMLFVFPTPGKYYFWMKDMKFSIDMIWINASDKVIYIKPDAKPEDYLETFGPDEDTKYVLEVRSGFSSVNDVKVGDTVTLSN